VKKIAFLTIQYPPTIGGLQAHVKGIVKLINECGYDIEVITSKPNPSMKIDGELEQNVIYLPSSFWFMDSPLINPFILYKILKKMNPDIIHVVYPFPLSFDIACLYARRYKKKLLCTYIDDIIVKFPYSLIVSIYQEVIFEYWIKFFSGISISSLEYAKESKCLKNWSGKLFVVPPPVFDTKYDFNYADKIQAKSELDLCKYSKVILFVGGLRKRLFYKRPDFLIKLWYKFLKNYETEYSLIIIGDGECKSKYFNLSKRLGIKPENITFIGFVPKEDLIKYYLASDVFILPSQDNNEAFGITVIESMLYGNVVIASDIPGFRGAIGDAKNISLVQPLNEKKFLETLEFWLSELKEHHAIENHKFVKARYDDEIIKNEIEKLYQIIEEG